MAMAKDVFGIYYMSTKMPDAQSPSFQPLGSGYAKDALNVYYMGQKLKGVVPYHFSLVHPE